MVCPIHMGDHKYCYAVP